MPFPLAKRHLTFAVDGVDCLAPEDSPQQVSAWNSKYEHLHPSLYHSIQWSILIVIT